MTLSEKDIWKLFFLGFWEHFKKKQTWGDMSAKWAHLGHCDVFEAQNDAFWCNTSHNTANSSCIHRMCDVQQNMRRLNKLTGSLWVDLGMSDVSNLGKHSLQNTIFVMFTIPKSGRTSAYATVYIIRTLLHTPNDVLNPVVDPGDFFAPIFPPFPTPCAI